MSTRRVPRTGRLTVALVGAVLGAVVGAGITAVPAHAAPVAVELWANPGTMTMPGGENVAVLGYEESDVAADAPGGPTITATVGDQVSITLHNGIGSATGLLVQGQSMVPDLDGVGGGGSTTYTFTAQRPGTFVYEAAPLPGAQYQSAMGLYGALVVHPATAGQAYDGGGSAYDSEEVLLLGEVDPALNNNPGGPAAFDMRHFAPTYFTINGRAYPDTAPVTAAPGTTTLLRYVNGGTLYHSMGVLGADQTVVGVDGNELRDPHTLVADTIGPGQTLDALVSVPASAAADTELVVHDAGPGLHNSNTPGVGGMLTTIPVAGTVASGDEAGPVVHGAALVGSDLTARADDSGRFGGSSIQAVQYAVGGVTGWVDLDPADGAFDTATEDAAATGLTVPDGQTVFFLRAQDAAGNWGPYASVLVTGADVGGPTVRSPQVTPNLVNGAPANESVTVSATADDSTSGGSPIDHGEYFVGATTGADGTGVTMPVGTAGATVASIEAKLPTAALAEGHHNVWIHAQDGEGNWGEAQYVQLDVDKTGPSTLGFQLSPTPNNGTLKFSASVPAVRVSVPEMSDPVSNDVNSPVAAAEAFLDTVGADGSGIPLTPDDGVFDTTSEGGFVDIPLTTVAQLGSGEHVVSVHARDKAGNWGPVTTATLVVDKQAPTTSGFSSSPDPTNGAPTVTLAGTATDTGTGGQAITRVEGWFGTDPGPGRATAGTVTGAGPDYQVTVDVPTAGQADGNRTAYVRVRDAAGNWSAPQPVATRISGPVAITTLGNAALADVTGAASRGDGYRWSGEAFSRLVDLSAAPYGVPEGANLDGFSREDDQTFYVSFATDTVLPGLGTVQDEDVAVWRDGAWSVHFNGTAHGLRAPAADIDALSVSGSDVYFSTRGNVRIRGVRGRADDADVYLWNGRRYARVWDASRHGVDRRADVDGYDRGAGGDFYLSFATTTRLAGVGLVQDEDVVENHDRRWSVYFDGSLHGLGTGAAYDVDGFDVP